MRLCGVEERLPGHVTFAERHGVAAAFALTPILEVRALDPTGVRVDPRDRVGASLDAGAAVELQRHVFRRTGGEDVHRPLAVNGSPLELMVVESGRHPERPQLLRGRRQAPGQFLPPVDADDLARAGQDDVLAADDLIQLDGFGQALRD